MFEKKLDKKDLKELRKMTELINQYMFVAKSIDAQKQAYTNSIVSKYGLDAKENYKIDLDKNKIIKVKKELRKPIK